MNLYYITWFGIYAPTLLVFGDVALIINSFMTHDNLSTCHMTDINLKKKNFKNIQHNKKYKFSHQE